MGEMEVPLDILHGASTQRGQSCVGDFTCGKDRQQASIPQVAEGGTHAHGVCQEALEQLTQAQPLCPESLSHSLEQIQEKDRRLEAILKTGQLRSRDGLDALAQRTRARQAYQDGDTR